MKTHPVKAFQLAGFAVLAACAGTTGAGMQDSRAPSAAKGVEERAYAELAAHLRIRPDTIETVRSEAHTWPDSSLGCGQPGTLAAQVISPGYAFVLKTPQGNYRVNATATHAVVCGAEARGRDFGIANRDAQANRDAAVSIRNLNAMVEAARRDLAAKLNVALESIQTKQFTATEWPDSSMECAIGGEPVTRRPVRGYLIELHHAGRDFTYHTDLQRVRACPAIEAQ